MSSGYEIISEYNPRLLGGNSTDLEPFGLIKVGVLHMVAPQGVFLTGSVVSYNCLLCDASPSRNLRLTLPVPAPLPILYG